MRWYELIIFLMPLPERAWVEAQSDKLLIRWENGDEASGKAAWDSLVVMALSEETGSSDYRFTEARRADGEYVWKPALKPTENEMPVEWIAFRNRQETLIKGFCFQGSSSSLLFWQIMNFLPVSILWRQ